MKQKIRAWHVFEGDPGYGDLLVYAPNRNSAKTLAMKDGPYPVDFYTGLRARRSPEHDSAGETEPRVVETNEGLANGLPPFYEEWR